MNVYAIPARNGLGEYPGYYCYDANRPSWLPYWIDDLTESECKYSLSTMAGDISACAAGDQSCASGLTTPWNPYPQNVTTPQNPSVSGGGVNPANQCGFLQSWNANDQQCEFSLTAPSTLGVSTGVLLLGALGVGAIVLFMVLTR